jgi:hypothetical protein
MDQMRDLMRADGFAQGREVGDIAAHEWHLPDLLSRQDQRQAAQVFLEIVDSDLVAAFQELAGDPATDTAIAACHQDSHLGSFMNPGATGRPFLSLKGCHNIAQGSALGPRHDARWSPERAKQILDC